LADPPAPVDLPIRPQTVRPKLEVAILSLLWASAVLAVLGVLAVALLPDLFARSGRVAEAVGLFAAVAAIAASWNVTTLRHMQAETSGGASYDRLRGQRGLRVASILLQMVELFAVVVVAIRLAAVAGLVQIDISPAVVDNGVRFLMATLAVACAAALSQSLRTPTERDRTPLTLVLAGLGLGGAAVLAALATLTALGRTEFLDPWLGLDILDTGIIALAGYAVLAFAVVRLRSLPTLTWLLYDERAGRTTTRLGTSRARAVLIPAVLAFALLLVVFFLFLLFGIGVGELFVQVGQSPLLVGVLAFLLVALLASLGIAFTLARSSQADEALYKELPDAEVRRIRTIVGGSIIGATLFALGAAAALAGYLPHDTWIHFLCLGLLTGLGPYGFYATREHARVRRLEDRFPDFLRDIASSHKGGLTLHQAAAIAARGEYGDLTPEVRKMADQLSWNVSFSEALERFADRVQTPLVQRAVSLILQANKSGGSTTDVLLAAARDAREIKNLENERRVTMGLYTVVVYITFFVFLGVAAILYAQFAPQIVASQQSVSQLQAGGASSTAAGFGGDSISLRQYQIFYFMAAVVQGVGDGIVAGLLGTGKAVLGLRHAFLMVLFAYITFAFLL
jgi:hypothetical protein